MMKMRFPAYQLFTVLLLAGLLPLALGCASQDEDVLMTGTAPAASVDDGSERLGVLADALDGPPDIRRVGGNLEATITGENGDYRFGKSRVDTHLPEGYPEPTPPGAIDIKHYPPVRRAEVSGRVNPNLGMNLGFWPLFQHIQRREIAMTSPVEMDYHGWDGDVSGPGRWTMSFLYRTADLGPTGSDGRIEVVDSEPLTVLAIGLTGRYHLSTVRRGLAELEAWLAEQDEWRATGDPRAFYYNDPSVPNDRKWLEVHLPIKPRTN